MTADLDRPVAGIRNTQCNAGPPLVEDEVAVRSQYFARDHGWR